MIRMPSFAAARLSASSTNAEPLSTWMDCGTPRAAKPLRNAAVSRTTSSNWPHRAPITVAELAPLIGKRAACRATGRPQASYYRRHRQSPPPPPVHGPKRAPRPQPRALSEAERAGVRAVLNSAGFVDQAPAAGYHQLLDEGVYLCS